MPSPSPLPPSARPRFTPINGKPKPEEGGEASSAAVLCLCGVGAAQAAEEARLVEGLRRLLAEGEDDDEEAASSVEVVVEPNRVGLNYHFCRQSGATAATVNAYPR